MKNIPNNNIVKTKTPGIDIIIVNWNTNKLLNNCLQSIQEYGETYVASTIVIDNNSYDDSQLCAINYENVELISLKNNLGFAKACNIGAKKANSEYYLFLNPDTRLENGTLKNVINFMELKNSKHIGICGVQLINDSGKPSQSCSRFPSLSRHFFHAIGLNKFLPYLGSPMREWSHAETREVDQVMGAFFLIRAKLFIDLEGFDERFFVYFEEVDLSFRAWLKGYKSIFLSECQAYHLGGGSSNIVKAKRVFYSERSRILYAFKYYTPFRCVCTLIISLLIEPITRTIFSLLIFSWKNLTEGWIAYFMLISWIPNLFKKEFRIRHSG